MDRRTFLSTAGAGVLAVSPARAASAPPLLRGGRFSEGVLSGDPTPTGITLATRLAGVEGRGSVLVEIARDAGFNRVVSRGRLLTGPGLGHAVKARVAGLRPHTRYWYRFSGRTADSSVGQFRTAPPAGSHQPVQFGIVYGIDFAAGYFNALTLLAKEDVDFVLNLGTYINSDPQAGTARPPYDVPAARSLPGYRLRYRSARADPGLRALHAAHALVSTWDDGEVASDYVGRDSAQSLKSAAYRAWFESMPHYPRRAGDARVYHRARFGGLVELYVCDTRQYRAQAPALGVADLLGAPQSRFVRGGLKRSTATWKLLATPAPVVGLVDSDNAAGWSGYSTAREELLATFDRSLDGDVAVLSGGLRRFAAADVADSHGKLIVPEFSPGTVTVRDDTEQSAIANAVEDDGTRHGYAVCSVAADLMTMRFEKVLTVASVSSESLRSVHELPRGQRTLEGA